MKYVIWILVLGLIIAHQDNWNWEDETLVFGFLPIGLFYHACISLAAGFVWWMACAFAWPPELDEADAAAAIAAQEKKLSQGGQG